VRALRSAGRRVTAQLEFRHRRAVPRSDLRLVDKARFYSVWMTRGGLGNIYALVGDDSILLPWGKQLRFAGSPAGRCLAPIDSMDYGHCRTLSAHRFRPRQCETLTWTAITIVVRCGQVSRHQHADLTNRETQKCDKARRTIAEVECVSLHRYGDTRIVMVRLLASFNTTEVCCT
jgi:hypothetical protein